MFRKVTYGYFGNVASPRQTPQDAIWGSIAWLAHWWPGPANRASAPRGSCQESVT